MITTEELLAAEIAFGPRTLSGRAPITLQPPVVSAPPAVAPPKPYSRPVGATTPTQRAVVQGQPCVTCGKTAPKQHANHKEPLVREYYRTGSIDQAKMRSLEAVEPHCPTCSAREGGFLSSFSKKMKEMFGFD
jgi:hypothetical protein